MRHAIPLVVILLGAVASAQILLPAGIWGRHPTFSALVVVLTCLPCYFYGFARRSDDLSGGAWKRPWHQFSLRTLLLVVTLVAISLGLYCGRARQQGTALTALGLRLSPDGAGLERSLPPDSASDERPGRWLPPPAVPPDGASDERSSPVLSEYFARFDYFPAEGLHDLENSMPSLARLPYLRGVQVSIHDSWSGDDGVEAARLYAEAEKARRDAITRLKRELPHVVVVVAFPPYLPPGYDGPIQPRPSRLAVRRGDQEAGP
jgi:hypothetical protein